MANSETTVEAISMNEARSESRTTTLRVFCVAAIVLLVVDYIYSTAIWDSLDENTLTLMSLNGLNAVIEQATWVSHAYYVVHILALALVAVGYEWSKYVFASAILLFAGTTMLFGMGISLPFQMLVGTFLGYLNGAILILLFARHFGEHRE